MARRDSNSPPPGEAAELGDAAWIAIGMQRMAIEHAPNWHTPYDRLAVMLRDYGLSKQSFDVIRESAALLPLYPRPPFETETDPAFLAAFAEGAWKGISESKELDRTPYRISLARLEQFRGESERSIQMLESALARKHDAAQRAEVEMLLGEAHTSLGHHAEALAHLQAAASYPPLEAPTLGLLARLGRAMGDTEAELAALQRLQVLRPNDVTVSLEHAAAALRLERWSAAEASIRRARLLAAEDPRPRLALIEMRIAQGETGSAASELRDFENQFGRTPESDDLRNRIGAAGTGG
jgi:tetratricopeptide (TPR) repeat protein